MKVTLTKMERAAVTPKFIVKTHLYSDLAYDVCRAYMAYDNGAVSEVDYKTVMRMPDGEVALAFQHSPHKMLEEEQSCNYKSWRAETATRLMRFIRGCIYNATHNNIHMQKCNSLRKLDTMIVQYKTDTYGNMQALTLSFNVAAAMYVYDVLLDHTKTFGQYDKSFASNVIGMPRDPVITEAIAAMKTQVKELGKKCTDKMEVIRDLYYMKKQAYAEECDKKCREEINAVLAEYGHEADKLLDEINAIA